VEKRSTISEIQSINMRYEHDLQELHVHFITSADIRKECDMQEPQYIVFFHLKISNHDTEAFYSAMKCEDCILIHINTIE
jgi:hypothetical protein